MTFPDSCHIPWHFRVFQTSGHLTFCASVCSGRISSETAAQIWLKFCTGTELCPGHCLVFWWRLPQGSRQGSRKSSFLKSTSTVLLFRSHYYMLVRQMAVQLYWYQYHGRNTVLVLHLPTCTVCTLHLHIIIVVSRVYLCSHFMSHCDYMPTQFFILLGSINE